MKKALLLLFCFYGSYNLAQGQYAPQAGINSSTAIPASSTQIVAWANNCAIQRGYLDISQPSNGHVSAGDSSLAVGTADNFIVSLGDSGVATLTFLNPIVNGDGPDFAVFENGFLNPENSEEAFLELAFVEVSSDGINFFRFPAASLTPTVQQISSVAGLDYMNARLLNNLAGKYISNYGTPFDLQELSGTQGLNINNITHVRIIDVVGAISGHSSFDQSGNRINDPYPTPFATGGFDLDAVGVLHQAGAAHTSSIARTQIKVYPNPATDYIQFSSEDALDLSITDLTGKLLMNSQALPGARISLQELPTGIYFLHLKDSEGIKWTERFVKQ